MYYETAPGDEELVANQEKRSTKSLYDNEEDSYLLALQLHEELNQSSSASEENHLTIIDQRWELIDPTPDVHQLFNQFNGEFFCGTLSSVFVEWNKRMTSCAGVCLYERTGNFCRISLSEPLLKLRPRKDLVETLLHEMIHAHLFVTKNRRDRHAHGEEFLKHMMRINRTSGTHITIYHTFVDEVNHYRQHWWRCTGDCQKWKPFYGYVKRAMNRVPSKKDRWFEEHQRRCRGEFLKVKEPSNDKKVKSDSPALFEPLSKKARRLPIGQASMDELLIKPTAFVECHFCRETVHRRNLQLHVDMKCPERVR